MTRQLDLKEKHTINDLQRKPIYFGGAVTLVEDAYTEDSLVTTTEITDFEGVERWLIEEEKITLEERKNRYNEIPDKPVELTQEEKEMFEWLRVEKRRLDKKVKIQKLPRDENLLYNWIKIEEKRLSKKMGAKPNMKLTKSERALERLVEDVSRENREREKLKEKELSKDNEFTDPRMSYWNPKWIVDPKEIKYIWKELNELLKLDLLACDIEQYISDKIAMKYDFTEYQLEMLLTKGTNHEDTEYTVLRVLKEFPEMKEFLRKQFHVMKKLRERMKERLDDLHDHTRDRLPPKEMRKLELGIEFIARENNRWLNNLYISRLWPEGFE